jgi:hypothetical protein
MTEGMKAGRGGIGVAMAKAPELIITQDNIYQNR